MNPRVFVYGTLQPGQRNWPLLAPHALAWHSATLWGFELWDLPEGYPAITSGEGRVQGVLVELEGGHVAQALALLDHLEDYRPQDPASLYLRRLVHVLPLGNMGPRPVRAHVYTIHPSRREHMRRRAARLPSGVWPPHPRDPTEPRE